MTKKTKQNDQIEQERPTLPIEWAGKLGDQVLAMATVSDELHTRFLEFLRLSHEQRFEIYQYLELTLAGICHALNAYHKALPEHYEDVDLDCMTCALIHLTEENGENPLEVLGGISESPAATRQRARLIKNTACA